MSGNTFGKIFKLTTFGESHGTAMGCILDGCPPQIELTKEDIQHELDKRKPGQSDVTTQRNCLLYTSPSPRDRQKSRMPSSA